MPALDVDLSGRTCLVTGASAGIGKVAALELARMNASVVLGCRSAEKGEAARQEIASATGNPRVEVMVVDVSSQASIRRFAAEFTARFPSLQVLLNNAGTWMNLRRESVDGIEMTWATNVLGYFLVTELLLDRLRASAPSRIVNVASDLAGKLDLDDVELKRRGYSGTKAYAQSKQADRMLTWALDRRLSGSGVTANALHPGGVNTEIFGKGGGALAKVAALYARISGKTPAEGARTSIHLAASPELAGVSGRYFGANTREKECVFHDPPVEERLWTLCARMTGQAQRSAA